MLDDQSTQWPGLVLPSNLLLQSLPLAARLPGTVEFSKFCFFDMRRRSRTGPATRLVGEWRVRYREVLFHKVARDRPQDFSGGMQAPEFTRIVGIRCVSLAGRRVSNGNSIRRIDVLFRGYLIALSVETRSTSGGMSTDAAAKLRRSHLVASPSVACTTFGRCGPHGKAPAPGALRPSPG